jgi:uncharacterized repeat protein (TIGR03803 family)
METTHEPPRERGQEEKMADLETFSLAKSFRIAALILATLAPAGAATTASAQTFSVLYNFGSGWADPRNPYMGPITQGRDGNLYGTTFLGGANNGGTVFKITPAGRFAVVYSLTAADGYAPFGGVTLGTDGSFYGSAPVGGSSGFGTLFKVTPGGTLTVLYNFSDGNDGANPEAPPVQGLGGNWYGTTSAEWEGSRGYGTVYKLTPAGQLTSLHQFDSTDGAFPEAPLVQATDGSFYGTTDGGGASVFKITPCGRFTALAGTGGLAPQAPLVQGNDGSFYGTGRSGVVFKVTPAGKVTVIYNFTPGTEPVAGLVQATDGNFYGATWSGGAMGYGMIYRISPDGSFSVLYNFDGTTGSNPGATLVQHTNGLLYGDTNSGGIYGGGTFYSLNIGLGPFVAFVRASGKVGATVQILGQGFTGTTAVSFNGTPASFTVRRDTFLVATVPQGATTGYVMVTTPSGTLQSNVQFRVRR